ncbi:hypothetical protein [Virgibacillus salexigens]|uniref:hypothetical protein n=1 Tax=Virgibacillus massiliensis TaxID=1462526 RepID=UPI0018E19072|nr:hypothetical protein [Virgibacillus massiliensis]
MITMYLFSATATNFVDTFTWREIVMLTSVVVTLIIGIFNLILTSRNKRKEQYINAVTTQRVKWMAKLRELSSDYIAQTTIHDHKIVLDYDLEAKTVYLDHVNKLNSEIKLHLNYKGELDQKIISIMDDIRDTLFEYYDVIEYMKMSDEERGMKLKELADKSVIEKEPVIQPKFLESLFTQGLHIYQKKIEDNEPYVTPYSVLDDLFKERYGLSGQRLLLNKVDKFTNLLRIYLKEEWESVKQEAEKGRIK